MRRMRILTVALLGASLLGGLSERRARAAWLTDWNVGATSVADVLGDVAVSQRDILQLWHKQDAGFHYFRMDLAAPPSQIAGVFAPEYSIHVDSGLGGGSAANTGYIANNLLDINAIITSHYTLASGFTSTHIHNYNALTPAPHVDTQNLTLLGGLFDSSESGGATLQWAVPIAALDLGPFTFYGATHAVDLPLTFDVTPGLDAVAVPEPATACLALLACGLGLLMLRRRSH